MKKQKLEYNLSFTKCVKCNTTFEKVQLNFFCDRCKYLTKENMQMNGDIVGNVGKIFKIWCKNKAHPLLKFEQHLININFEKYFNYEPVFIGKLVYVYNDKWCQGTKIRFDNVTFSNNKNKIVDKWNVDICDILYYEIV